MHFPSLFLVLKSSIYLLIFNLVLLVVIIIIYAGRHDDVAMHLPYDEGIEFVAIKLAFRPRLVACQSWRRRKERRL